MRIGGHTMIAVTTTDLQNNFGKYLQAVQLGDEIIVLKNGAEVALTGVLKGDYDDKAIRAERVAKYESAP